MFKMCVLNFFGNNEGGEYTGYIFSIMYPKLTLNLAFEVWGWLEYFKYLSLLQKIPVCKIKISHHLDHNLVQEVVSSNPALAKILNGTTTTIIDVFSEKELQ